MIGHAHVLPFFPLLVYLFYHQRFRPDRDDYVEIIWDHIKEGNLHARTNVATVSSAVKSTQNRRTFHHLKQGKQNWKF